MTSTAELVITTKKILDILDGFTFTDSRLMVDAVASIDNIDVALSTRASEETLSSMLDQLDVKLSTLARTRVYEQTFEDGTTDTTVDNATQTVQSSVVYGGNYALQVTIAAGNTGSVETPTRPVSAGQSVSFAFAHKEDANITDVKLIVRWFRASGGEISSEEYTLTPSATWTVDSRTVTAPQNAATMSLKMQATAGASDGNVYLDEMTIDLVGQILRVDGAGRVMVTDTDVYDVLNTQLDVLLSTRASESTLSGIKTQTDKLTFDASNFLRMALASDEVGIAKESTLASELTRLAKLRGYDAGTATWQDVQTDGSGRLKAQLDSLPNPSNLDVLLSTRASETTLSSVDSKLGDIRGALGSVATDVLRISDAGGSLTIDNTNIDTYIPNIDRALSAVFPTGSFHNADFDTGLGTVNRFAIGLIVPADGGPTVIDPRDRNWTITETLNIGNPPNLDVALSTRLSESTFTGRFPAATALGDALANPTTTIIGSALLGWDSAGAVWERLQTDGSGRLLIWLGG